jgi:N-acetylmuramic acid 6-phosphate etherase
MLRLLNAEYARVPAAVAAELPRIATAVDAIADRLRAGGRLIYQGAGTSGRLGVLDAAECPPTFGTAPTQVIGLLAGGERALTEAVEGAEDDAAAGAAAVADLAVGARDCLVGISASGRTPYALGGLAEARRRGALTIALTCAHPSPLAEAADLAITPLVGSEAIAGSTRLKAGTAQKLVLNMLSTGVMIRLGRTYGSLMVDARPTNAKLRRRAARIVATAANLSEAAATAQLAAAGGEVKVAIVAALAGLSPAEARSRLVATGGLIHAALASGAGEERAGPAGGSGAESR